MPRIIPRSEEELLLAKQRRYLRALARKIKAGEQLDDRERVRAAATITAWADLCMVWQPPSRKRGQEAKVDHSAVAIRFAWLIHGASSEISLNKDPAYNLVAEEFGISVTAVKKIIEKRGRWAEMLVAGQVKSSKQKPPKN